MQRTLTRLSCLTAAGLLAALPLAAKPQGAGAGGGQGRLGRGPGGGAGFAQYLGLSADQQGQIQELRKGQQPQIRSLGQQLRENHQKLEAALDAASPDPATVGTIAIEGRALERQMKEIRDSLDGEIRALLTPDQQTKFDALQALRRERGPMMMRSGMPPAEE